MGENSKDIYHNPIIHFSHFPHQISTLKLRKETVERWVIFRPQFIVFLSIKKIKNFKIIIFKNIK